MRARGPLIYHMAENRWSRRQNSLKVVDSRTGRLVQEAWLDRPPIAQHFAQYVDYYGTVC